MAAGDALSFDWNFLTNDNRNDVAFVTVRLNGSTTTETLLLSGNGVNPSLSSLPFSLARPGAQTRYGTFNHFFNQAGTYEIGLGVVDRGTNAIASALALDNFLVYSFPASIPTPDPVLIPDPVPTPDPTPDPVFVPTPGVTGVGEVGAVANFQQAIAGPAGGSRVSFQGTYQNPVVFASPLSNGHDSPAIVRITGIDGDGFNFYLQETSNQDGLRSGSFSFLVLEAGTFELEGGAIVQVGTRQTSVTTQSQAWEQVDITGLNTPVFLSQVQTNNDATFVRTRHDSIAGGFSFALEEEEAGLSTPHGSETVGYLAIAAAAATLAVYRSLPPIRAIASPAASTTLVLGKPLRLSLTCSPRSRAMTTETRRALPIEICLLEAFACAFRRTQPAIRKPPTAVKVSITWRSEAAAS
ncbi:MAG: hypothetical protein HC890_01625 [Chloroflexaceae bacterium]|nr:hypothetical protein [Chloroflexaceae bacterium]